MSDIEKLRELLAKATPGPWRQPFPVDAGSVVQIADCYMDLWIDHDTTGEAKAALRALSNRDRRKISR